MTSRSKGAGDGPGELVSGFVRELEGVEDFLHSLRHNRGRWPRKWATSMIRHYEKRRELLRSRISTHKRKTKKVKS